MLKYTKYWANWGDLVPLDEEVFKVKLSLYVTIGNKMGTVTTKEESFVM